MRLALNFYKKVMGGGRLHQKLCSTATGTGLGYHLVTGLGVLCLDRAAGDWFICTASASNGTWVKVNA